MYYPPPNAQATGYNWFTIRTVGNDGDQFNVRIDYNVSDKHRIFARYTYWNAQDIPFRHVCNDDPPTPPARTSRIRRSSETPTPSAPPLFWTSASRT